MSWSARAPLAIVAVSVVPAGILLEVAHEVGDWPGWVALAGAGVALLWSTALWFRRREERGQLVLGLGAAVLVFAMAGLGVWRGSSEAAGDFEGAAQTSLDLDRFGSWMGQTTVDGVQYFAVEHPAGTAIAQKLGAMFERRFVALLVTVDNRAGKAPVELDVVDARLEPESVGKGAVLPRASVLDSAREARELAHQMHGGRYVVPPGGRLGGGLVFVDPARALDKITGLAVSVNGKPLTISGRYYTAEEKQAMRKQKRS